MTYILLFSHPPIQLRMWTTYCLVGYLHVLYFCSATLHSENCLVGDLDVLTIITFVQPPSLLRTWPTYCLENDYSRPIPLFSQPPF